MALLQLVSGTIEELQITVEDESGAITDMTPLSPQFYVNDTTPTTVIALTAPVSIVGMILFCLVDTTGLPKGQYNLYVTWTDGTETPILGPIQFFIV